MEEIWSDGYLSDDSSFYGSSRQAELSCFYH